MDWLKALASALGLAEWWARRSQQGKDEANGASRQREADGAAREAALDAAGAPVGAAESNQLWRRNKARFEPGDTGAG